MLRSAPLLLALVVAVPGVAAARDIAGGVGATVDVEAGAMVETGYGSVLVTGTRLANGLTHEDLNGMTHGIPGLVSDKEQMVTVNVSVTGSAGDRAREPQDLMLSAGSGDPVAPVGGTLSAGPVVAGGAVTGTVNFVVGGSLEELSLLVGDADGGRAAVPLRLTR